MWIAHAFIHVCWCTSDTSLHLREAPLYLMLSWHYHTILYPHLSGSLLAKMMSLNDDEEPIQIFTRNSNKVCKFVICFMFVQFWSHLTCYSPIINANHLSFKKNEIAVACRR